jgi:hypothetical protein
MQHSLLNIDPSNMGMRKKKRVSKSGRLLYYWIIAKYHIKRVTWCNSGNGQKFYAGGFPPPLESTRKGEKKRTNKTMGESHFGAGCVGWVCVKTVPEILSAVTSCRRFGQRLWVTIFTKMTRGCIIIYSDDTFYTQIIIHDDDDLLSVCI